MVGAPVVTREIQVRVLVGEPIRRGRLTGRTLGSQPNNRSSSLRRGTSNAHVAQLDKAPDYESGRCRFESCRVLQSSACRGAWSSLPALEAGDRWFKSIHADHTTQEEQEGVIATSRSTASTSPMGHPYKDESGARALWHCPRSSADESGRLLNGGSGVQVTPRAPNSDGWPSGKATRC